jgi:hypothetical protein
MQKCQEAKRETSSNLFFVYFNVFTPGLWIRIRIRIRIGSGINDFWSRIRIPDTRKTKQRQKSLFSDFFIYINFYARNSTN